MSSTSTTESKKKKISTLFKDETTSWLIVLLLFTTVFRLYYFFVLNNQPIWWDEGDYLAIAKVWALGQSTPEWWSHFTGIRPLLIPIIWAALFKIGFGELFIRFATVLLPSILSIYLVYLIGKSLYDSRVGLISATMMSFYWVSTFYSYRLLTDLPALFFGLCCIYFFWNIYIKQGKPYGLYLCYLFGVLALSTRFALALVPISCVVYLALVKGPSLTKDKTFWKSVGLGFLFISPWIIYFFYNQFFLFKFYFGSASVHDTQFSWGLLTFMFSLLEPIWALSLGIGLISLLSIFLYMDLIWKNKETRVNPNIFLIILILAHLIFYIAIFKSYTDRWILMMMPALFIVAGRGIVLVKDYVSKYNRLIGLLIAIFLVLGGAYQNIVHSTNLINEKKESYLEVKLGGLWLRDNTPQDSKIITSSVVQNQYYSERDSYDFHTTDPIWAACSDKYGSLSTNASCQNTTEAIFDTKVLQVKPSYLIVSIFEPVFTPQWAYTYPQKHNLTLVQAYTQKDGQPLLFIYKFPKN